MNQVQLRAVLEAMERIERGEPTPLVGGEVGRFLAAYARERREAERLAFSQGITIQHDQGAIPVDTETARLIPAPTTSPFATFPTTWGEVTIGLVFCPELHTILTLRLWHSAYAAREAIRELAAWPNGTIEVTGSFRWLPPNVATAGEASYAGRPSAPHEFWRDLAFLAATADDLYAPPHALEYIVGRVSGKTRIAHVRSFIVKAEPNGDELVPGGTFVDPVRLRRTANSLSLPPGLWMVLGLRAAETDCWDLWVAEPATPDAALRHLVGWRAFRAWLREEPLDQGVIEENARRALTAIDIGPSSGPVTPPSLPAPSSGTLRFARSLLASMRLG